MMDSDYVLLTVTAKNYRRLRDAEGEGFKHGNILIIEFKILAEDGGQKICYLITSEAPISAVVTINVILKSVA